MDGFLGESWVVPPWGRTWSFPLLTCQRLLPALPQPAAVPLDGTVALWCTTTIISFYLRCIQPGKEPKPILSVLVLGTKRAKGFLHQSEDALVLPRHLPEPSRTLKQGDLLCVFFSSIF